MTDERIHIIHVLSTLDPGGMEGGVVNIVNGIDPEKFKVSICCLESSGILEQKIQKDKRRIFVMNKKPGRAWFLPFRLKKLFREQNAHIVHTHNYSTLIYGALGSLFPGGPRLVHGEHGDLPLQINNSWYMFVRKLLCSGAAGFHTVSKSLKHMLEKYVGIPSGKIRHIPNGLDLKRFMPHDRLLLRKEAGFSEEEFILVAIGSFYPWKNQKLVIETASGLRKRGLNFIMLLIGEGPLEKELKTMVKEKDLENHVRFPGYMNNIEDYLNLSDVLIQPSLTEGMANTIMEAMACGIPVLASDVGGNPELVRHGETGYLFPVDNMDMLLDQINDLYEQREERALMGENARRIAEQEYEIRDMIKQYEQLYESSTG
ncbi:glycosyltransferase [Verrucomicrobiota bacterium]